MKTPCHRTSLWDHKIKIKEGMQNRRKNPLRPMSAEKAEYVRKYVDEGLRKRTHLRIGITRRIPATYRTRKATSTAYAWITAD